MTTAYNSISKSVSTENYKTKNASCVLGLTRASSVVSEPMSLATSANRGGQKNGYPVVSTTFGKVKALSAGTFAYGPAANKFVMLGNNVCITLSGTSNTVLASSAADYRRRSNPFKLTSRTTFLLTLSWTSTSISGPRYTFTESDSTIVLNMGGTGTDTVADLSAANRSSVYYMVNGKQHTETAYKALTLW